MHVPPATRITGPAADAPAAPPPPRPASGGFRAALHAEQTTASRRDRTGGAGGAEPAASPRPSSVPRGPRNERIERVPGHSYAEIVAGPRNGMFLNLSGNARHGQAFTVVERRDGTFHVYGTGADREVLRVGRGAERAQASRDADGAAGARRR